jgi:hypothetical protein
MSMNKYMRKDILQKKPSYIDHETAKEKEHWVVRKNSGKGIVTRD